MLYKLKDFFIFSHVKTQILYYLKITSYVDNSYLSDKLFYLQI